MKIPPDLIRIIQKSNTSIQTRFTKLTEEVGELAEQVLILQGEKDGVGGLKDLYNLYLEVVDVHIMALAMIVATGITEEEVDQIMKSQLEKWEKWIDKKALNN